MYKRSEVRIREPRVEKKSLTAETELRGRGLGLSGQEEDIHRVLHHLRTRERVQDLSRKNRCSAENPTLKPISSLLTYLHKGNETRASDNIRGSWEVAPCVPGVGWR